MDKIHAIRGAIKGKWINILITDSNVGASLMNEG
jgi:DNA-binding transcriptional regulator LsrR (DeoR family)